MLTPTKITQKTIEVGQVKANLSAGKMLALGILAGAFIGLAGVGATLGSAYGDNKLIGACIFPIGLIMVVIAGSELFTGNNLMIMATLDRKIAWRKMFKNWLIVLIGNCLGAILVALMVVYSGVLDAVSSLVIETATIKSNLSFLEALFRGIFCNFLVCIAVWMAFAAKTVNGKILAIFPPIMLFVLCGFEHSIANMYYGPAGIFLAAKNNLFAELTLETFFIQNLIPVIIGNCLGGAIFVGCTYYLIYADSHSKAK